MTRQTSNAFAEARSCHAGGLLGCGLRRSKPSIMDHLQQREDHWAIVDLIGKGGHIRTVPVPEWVTASVDSWTTTAHIITGRIFRCVNKTGSVWGNGITEKVAWSVVKEFAARAAIDKLAPHDLRRATWRVESWSRFNSYWDMLVCKPLNGIWAANSACGSP